MKNKKKKRRNWDYDFLTFRKFGERQTQCDSKSGSHSRQQKQQCHPYLCVLICQVTIWRTCVRTTWRKSIKRSLMERAPRAHRRGVRVGAVPSRAHRRGVRARAVLRRCHTGAVLRRCHLCSITTSCFPQIIWICHCSRHSSTGDQGVRSSAPT